MYAKIKNPETGKNVNINSKLGRQIFKNYLRTLYGGVRHKDYCEKYS